MGYMYSKAEKSVKINDIDLELIDVGSGPALLYLHPVDGVSAKLPFIEKLSGQFRVLAPSHPGFGTSTLPTGVITPDDLAYIYLDLLDRLDLEDVTLVGSSFGGWVAAEIATKSTKRLARLVLADTTGVKFGSHLQQDVTDYFQVAIEGLPALLFHDQKIGLEAFNGLDFSSLPDDEVLAFARNRDSFCLFSYNPNGFNPALKRRLHRIDIPTLVLWGEEDKIVPVSYGKQFAESIPGAIFNTIPACGHYSHIEKPDEFTSAIIGFANT